MNFPRMRIPVFISCPSNLSDEQEQSAMIIAELLNKYKLEWRALGRSDYPNELPLREVLRMVKHCSGGIILGFEQFYSATGGTFKRGTKRSETVNAEIKFPTAWNHLEAGILFNQKLPIMIFKEEGIRSEGIFDIGTSEIFINKMPQPTISKQDLDDLDSAFQKWAAKVSSHYYAF